jgi:hypothetical protein
MSTNQNGEGAWILVLATFLVIIAIVFLGNLPR